MKKHWQYLKYVIRHKRFVYQEGRKLGLGRWQLIKHDWSKFLPSEWFPYARFFYGGARTALAMWEFKAAWLKHQHRNPHHWQHWVLREDSGEVKVLDMPDKYRREMLADWRGAGRAIHGKDETASWYEKTKSGRMLYPDTLVWVERELGVEQ